MTRGSLEGKSVLLVDDTRFSQQTVARQLAGEGLKEIFFAKNGRDGLRTLASARDQIGFVISDINMPEMNGLDFLKAIRDGTAECARDLPVALLTGYAERDLVEVAIALDVNAFLIKPVSKAALLARLTQMFKHSEREDRLKPEDRYERVSVAKAIAQSQVAIDAERAEEEARLLSEAMIRKARASREAMHGRIKKSAGGAVADNSELVTLDTLPEGAILAHDVCTPKGMVLASAGTVLTPGVVSLFIDARHLGHEIDVIRIKPERAR